MYLPVGGKPVLRGQRVASVCWVASVPVGEQKKHRSLQARHNQQSHHVRAHTHTHTFMHIHAHLQHACACAGTRAHKHHCSQVHAHTGVHCCLPAFVYQ